MSDLEATNLRHIIWAVVIGLAIVCAALAYGGTMSHAEEARRDAIEVQMAQAGYHHAKEGEWVK